MKYQLTTYRTLTGSKSILEIANKTSGQWIVYQNNEPTYLVDCFDFKEESNLILNNLILSERKSIDEVLKKIKKRKKVNLSVKRPPIIEIKLTSKTTRVELAPIPEDWLS